MALDTLIIIKHVSDLSVCNYLIFIDADFIKKCINTYKAYTSHPSFTHMRFFNYFLPYVINNNNLECDHSRRAIVSPPPAAADKG